MPPVPMTGRLALLHELASSGCLQVEHVGMTYPGRFGRPALEAVRGVSFGVAAGEILALLGPNGAGKTTTIKMMAGLLVPTQGRILVAGQDVARHRSRAVRRLGAVLEGNRNLHWKLTVRENLKYFGALKGLGRLKDRSEALIARLDLGEHAHKRVGELSRGNQQRVAIAVALMGEPQLLLLDEPTLGLDVVAATTFKETVRAIAAEGCGIVLTTHQMEVAQSLASRVAIIAGGRLATLQSLDQLLAAHRTPGYEVEVRGELSAALRTRLTELGADEPTVDGATFRFNIPEGHSEALYRILEPLRETRHELIGVRQAEINLEEVYRRVVGGTP